MHTARRAGASIGQGGQHRVALLEPGELVGRGRPREDRLGQVDDVPQGVALAEIKKSGRLEFYEQTEADVKAFQQAAEKVVSDYEQKTGRDIIDKLKAMN